MKGGNLIFQLQDYLNTRREKIKFWLGSVFSSRIIIFLWNSIFPSTDHDGKNGNVRSKSLNFVNSNMK